MIKYNICFIRQHDTILLLNREAPSWMGCWNGIGGKLEPGETPRDSMLRELEEETGITGHAPVYKGLVTWTTERGEAGGMYLYTLELESGYRLETPLKTPEGILDWKTLAWIMHPDNQGLAANVPRFLPAALEDPRCYDHHCSFRGGKLEGVRQLVIARETENIEQASRYMQRYSTMRTAAD
ncbi:8-oxo-dGTP diphosphatase [Paenibacillus sp. IB182496]|uniref:8-oxo-dGTP diphosphatase n=1 Tax=Paenibacillus sabuli TaxID=2772509 RepID=A0A927BYD9_9BACL|nr:8-oxo-dGTP diphosphatase [Paenibacillus sabuli]MBD2847689.1 8-oxo-dGTP diphosphatase [Paenibacillus sabuli]